MRKIALTLIVTSALALAACESSEPRPPVGGGNAVTGGDEPGREPRVPSDNEPL